MLRILGVSLGVGLLVATLIAIAFGGFALIEFLPLVAWATKLFQISWIVGWITACSVAFFMWLEY